MTPQEERDLLLRVVTQVAEKKLSEGGFVPFGATLGSERDVKILLPKTMKPGVTKAELDAYWTQALRKAAAEGDCKTVCSCANVRFEENPGEMVSAIHIHIEHAEAYSANVLCPYRHEGGSRVIFGEPQVEPSEHQVFARDAEETAKSRIN